ncbi:hypothetical protein ACFY6U_21520 [Streptomyces sp. NPDC013157]|uniref:hypothetical protein n=1 Tax=Streptomyces sp. NPDC013157 TaxID=3364861 RepID=UPI00369CB47C
MVADLTGALAEGDVLGPVDGVLDDPVRACPGRDLLRGGLLGAQTGDGVGGLGLPLLLADAAALAADAHHLAGMQEAQSAGGDDLDFADLFPALPRSREQSRTGT